ncbi:MAG: XdhC family protein [Anaerolineaceae bacterium]|nr:XdhC family protein [Anaerolineaceae bacterium]
MREVLTEIEKWQQEGKQVAIATNVKRAGMSLRPLGAKMAATPKMEIAGSVTGGCLEGAVYEEAQQVLKTGQSKLLHYGVSGDQKPWDIGLTCGSSLDIFVESLQTPAWKALLPMVEKCLHENTLAAVVTVISGKGVGNKMLVYADGSRVSTLGHEHLNESVLLWVKEQLDLQESNWKHFESEGEQVEVFVDVLVPELRLIVIGAGHIAIPLLAMAKAMGFRTVLIDPREAFATPERFPDVDELIKEWPSTALAKMPLDASTYVAAISHDEKLDNPALALALQANTRYVGVLGTRKNIGKRLLELKELGVSDEQLVKLRAPIGVPLGAILPEEIAVSILAEMTEARHGMLAPQQK